MNNIEKYQKQLDNALSKVLKKHYNGFELHENYYLVNKICNQMLEEIIKNPKLTYTQAAEKSVKKVKKQIKLQIKEMFSIMPKKEAEKILGKDIVKKLYK